MCDPWNGSNWSMRTSVILAVPTSRTFSKSMSGRELRSKDVRHATKHWRRDGAREARHPPAAGFFEPIRPVPLITMTFMV